MTLYQLIGDKNVEQLESDLELRKSSSDYEKFLNNVRSIKVKGDADGKVKASVVKTLLLALDETPDKRPTFEELKEMLLDREFCKEELKKTQDALENTIKERDKRIASLQDENIRLKEEPDKLKLEAQSYFHKVIIKTAKLTSNSPSTTQSMVVLAKEISMAKSLTHLALGFNKLSSEAIKALAHTLILNTSLRGLFLGRWEEKTLEESVDWVFRETDVEEYYNGGDGVWEEVVKKNYQLVSRDVHIENSNEAKKEGARAIAKALKFTSLEKLDLGYCNIATDIFVELVTNANESKTLKWICIEGNPELKGMQSTLKVVNVRPDLVIEL
eukprot:TRINITY_DN13637_c0_g3_i1.p1 TRINITY_DN13637_c0_g3~~TRINITY_DN13637_c0_g3_i1.p1  ORF type:complete len:329 (-),score=91.98 TRINITY_DN13637_c0_g3_i1:71-1057(-)